MADAKLNVSPEESPQICLPFVRVPKNKAKNY